MLRKIESYISKERLVACELLQKGLVQFGDFTLKSGLQSPIYIDLRLLVGHPILLTQVAELMSARLIQSIPSWGTVDRLAAIPYGGLPLTTALSLQTQMPFIFARGETKGYGAKKRIEGPYQLTDRVVLVDDLVSTMAAKNETAAVFELEGLTVVGILVFIDRRHPTIESKYPLEAIFRLEDLLQIWEEEDLVSAENILKVQNFLVSFAS